MAGFQRTNLLQPWSTRSPSDEWMTRIVPEEDYSHSLMVDPTGVDWSPQVTPYREAAPMSPPDTGFAGYLRDYYLPNTYIAKTKGR